MDTTLAKPACERLQGLFDRIEKAVREDDDAYSSIAIAGTKAYNFDLNIQVDLVDFLTIMGKSDYDDRICSDEELEDIIRDVRACVLYRNQDSAEGINGIAFAFPYQAASYYTDTSAQLKAMSLKEERDAFNVIFSIIAAQKKKETQDPDYYSNLIAQSASDEGNPLDNMANEFMSGKLTEEDWYIEGFEDYDTTEALSDIPLKETQEGYEIQAPEKIWDIIADVQTMVYMRGEKKGNRVYLGRTHQLSKDKNGHPTVRMDDSWIHIAGQPVCYEADPVRETKKGKIYSGKVKAKLNDTDEILLKVEWDPVKNGEGPKVGHVIGYEAEPNDIFAAVLNTRESQNLKAGDTIRFLFDSYDKDGKFIKTAAVGKKVHVTKQGRLKVENAPIGSRSISIGGALTDIYQRTMTTELVEPDLKQ